MFNKSLNLRTFSSRFCEMDIELLPRNTFSFILAIVLSVILNISGLIHWLKIYNKSAFINLLSEKRITAAFLYSPSFLDKIPISSCKHSLVMKIFSSTFFFNHKMLSSMNSNIWSQCCKLWVKKQNKTKKLLNIPPPKKKTGVGI